METLGRQLLEGVNDTRERLRFLDTQIIVKALSEKQASESAWMRGNHSARRCGCS